MSDKYSSIYMAPSTQLFLQIAPVALAKVSSRLVGKHCETGDIIIREN